MKNKIVFKYLGKVLIGFSLLFIFPIIISLIYHESFIQFLIPLFISLFFGLLLNKLKVENNRIFAREGFIIVAISWIVICIIGSLPFWINNDLSYVDALFETVSGFTTTGASVINDVESLNKGMLFWRSFSHFIGGMGVLVFVMAIIPLAQNDKSMHLLKAEMSGPKVSKLVPSMKKTLLYLYGVYIFLTLLLFVLLLIGKLSVFDSLTIALGTAGTGGFTILNSSFATYSVFIKVVITIFMFLFGINFNIFFLLLLRDFKSVFKSEELRVYISLYIIATVVILFNTVSYFGNFNEAVLESFFHVGSLMTGTGYSIGDINIYGTYARVLMLFLMVVSGCAGSTCGGFKISRMIICFKSIKRDLYKLIHPTSIQTIKYDNKTLDEETIKSTNTFLFLYFILIIFIIFLVSFNGFSLEITINSVFSTFANVGLCFDLDTFASFSNFSKIVLCFSMLLGRLEIFPMIILFTSLRKN